MADTASRSQPAAPTARCSAFSPVAPNLHRCEGMQRWLVFKTGRPRPPVRHAHHLLVHLLGDLLELEQALQLEQATMTRTANQGLRHLGGGLLTPHGLLGLGRLPPP